MADYLYLPGANRGVVTFFRSMARLFPSEFGENIREAVTLYDTYDQSLTRRGFMFIQGKSAVRLLQLTTFTGREYPFGETIRSDWWKHPSSEWENVLEKLIPLQSLLPIWTGALNRRIITMKNRNLENYATIELMTWGRESLIHIGGNKKNRGFLEQVNDYLLSRGFIPCSEPWPIHLMESKGKPVRTTPSLNTILASPALAVRRAAGDIVLHYLHTARYYETGIIEDVDTECLHQYRVYIRKIRSIVSLLKTVFPVDDVARLKNDFRRIQQQTNVLRDHDVQMLSTKEENGIFPVEITGERAAIAEHTAKRRAAELDMVRVFFSSENYAATMIMLERYFETLYKLPETAESVQPVGDTAKKILHEIYRRVRKKSAHLHEDTPDEQIHRLRIETKKIRYIIEFFQPLFPLKPTKKLIRQMKKIQTILGEFNDLAVRNRRLLRECEKLKNTAGNEGRLLNIGIMIGCIYTRRRYLKSVVLAEAEKLRGETIQSLVEEITGIYQ